MKRLSMAAAVAGVGVGVAVRRMSRIGARSRQRHEAVGRWLVVTVNRPPEEVGRPDAPPDPLAALADRIEVRVRPAAGEKGTELGARLRDPGPSGGPVARLVGEDPAQEVRLALREAKSLIETGDVLRADPPSAHPGPAGKLVRAASRLARGEGRL